MSKRNSPSTPRKKIHRAVLSLGLAFCLVSTANIPAVFAAAGDKDPLQEKFLEAMKKREAGQYYEAVTLFQNILTDQPKLHRARLELAATYYRTFNYQEAKRQAQIVLDDPQTPENVRITIAAFLAQIEKEAQGMVAGHTWKPNAGVGWMYDTNVNVGPASNITIIGTLDPSVTRTGDSAFIAEAGLTHRYQTEKTPQISQKNAQFLWQTNANLYHRDYFDEHAFDLQIFSIATGPALVVLGDWRGNLNLQEEFIRYGSEELAYFTSLMPSMTKHFLNGKVEFTVDAILAHQDYQRDLDAGRDGTYGSLQLSLGRVFFDGKFALQAGVRYFDENAEAIRWANSGTGGFLGSAWRFYDRSNVYGRIYHEDVEYDGAEPVFDVKRDERTSRYTIGLEHTFNSRGLDQWKISGEYMRQDTYSNISVYEYDREQVTVMFSRSF
jgi:hypothetical protein